MENFTNNKEELTNLNSFSSKASEKIYQNYRLKGVEIKIIKKYFTEPGAKTLDIGCGYGRTTRPLFEMGLDVTGIDIVENMITAAKADNPQIEFKLMSAAKIEYPDNFFDYILFSFNGIDFIYPKKRRIKALQEINRVLKPGGTFIVSSHNKMRLFTKFNLHYIEIIFKNLVSGRLFSNYLKARHEEGELITYFSPPFCQKRDFKKAGFQILEIMGKKYNNELLINLFEGWPYYALKKQ